MSSFLEMRSLTFDRAVVLPLADDIDVSAPTEDWVRDGGSIKASPVALSRLTTAASVSVKARIRIKKVLPPLTKVRATLGSGYPLAGISPATLLHTSVGTRVVNLQIELPPLNGRTVGAFNVGLTWEFRKPGETSWTTFDTTTHRVFALAAEPVIPWGRPGVANRVVPWTAVLERACRWATGKKSTEACVNAITKQAFGLGGQIIPHSNTDSTTIEYGDGSSFDNGNGGFFLKNFLDTANLTKDADGFLNCTDLAGAVALLSSAIGCPVGIARIAPNSPAGTIKTHFMQLIGQATPAEAEFNYHEFAAAMISPNALGAGAWDACGKLEETPPPATSLLSVSTLAIPVNWALHAGQAPVYSTQLLPSGQQLKIELIEGIGGQPAGILFPEEFPTIGAIAVDKFLLDREQVLNQLLEPVPLPTGPVSPSVAAKVKAILLSNTSADRQRVTWATNRPYPNTVARLRPTSGPQTIRMSFVTAGGDAHKIFLRWAARFVTRVTARTGIGHAAIHAPQSDSIVMRVGDTVIQLTGERKHVPSIDVIAQSLVRALQTVYP